MRFHTVLIFLPLLVIGTGCPPRTGTQGGNANTAEGKLQGRMPNAPASPPPAPQPRKVPLDRVLASTADRVLTEALAAGDPIHRAHGLEGIRNCNATQHKPDILKALNDPEAIVRFAAALTAGELRIVEAHDPLLKLADDPSENVRVAVRFALHRLGDVRLSHDLEQMANDPDPRVRGNTAMVLGMLGDPSALRILRILQFDPNIPVRQNAWEAMWRLKDEEGLHDLVSLTLSRYPDDRILGYLALALPGDTRIRQHVRDGLVIELDGEGREIWPEVTLVAARAMGMLGSDEGYAIAQKGAASTDARQRYLAAAAFGAIGRSDAQDILRKLLTDQNEDVRIAAATAILQLKE